MISSYKILIFYTLFILDFIYIDCQFFPGFGVFSSPRRDFYSRRRWHNNDDVEWIKSPDNLHNKDDLEDDTGGGGSPRCPNRMTCVSNCKHTTPFKTYCGWAAGPLICCPISNRNQNIIRKRPSRCGVIDTTDGRIGGSNKKIVLSIVGGVQLRTAQASPWMVAIGERSGKRGGISGPVSWYCGGSLISDKWVLTAAHCASKRRADVVRVGEVDFSRIDEPSDPQDIIVTNITIHSEYKPSSFYHDLALLKLKDTVKFSKYIKPICIPSQGESKDLDGSLAMLTGWGHTEFGGESSSILQEVGVTIIPNKECGESYSKLAISRRNYPEGMTNQLLCAGDMLTGGKDACQGDSGGPLVVRNNNVYTQVGIISSGVGCGSKTFPGVYIRVSMYSSWINSIISAPIPSQLERIFNIS